MNSRPIPITVTVAVDIACLVICLAHIWMSSAQLPEQVAWHFVAGPADGFVARESYRWLMIGMSLGVTLPILLVSLRLHTFSPRCLYVPRRDYWLAPARREATLHVLQMHGHLLAWQTQLAIWLLHVMVLQANHNHPPRAPELSFFQSLWAVGFFLWLYGLVRYFRRAG